MPNTKLALESSLKKLLLRKPLDKITINDLTADCGISRMSFYYHFRDIYDLVEWVCVEDGRRALQGKKTYETWQEGLGQIFEAVLENKPFILNVYRAVSRDKIESYLYKLTYSLIADVVEEKSAGTVLAEEDRAFFFAEPIPVYGLFRKKPGMLKTKRFQLKGQILIPNVPLIGKLKKFPFSAAFGAAMIVTIRPTPAFVYFGRIPDHLRIRTNQKKVPPTLQFLTT